MNTGNKLYRLLHQVADDAFYIDDDYPRMAERMIRLVELVRAYDKNQKALIHLVLKLQRENKALNKIEKRMYTLMNNGQKNIIDTWLEGGDDK